MKNDSPDSKNSDETKNESMLQLDANIADAHIKFPTDLSLLNNSREKSEEMVDQLCLYLGLTKPITYRRLARKSWLNISKSKKSSYKKIQTGIKQQLNYLKRNLKNIDKILYENPLSLYHLPSKVKQRIFLACFESPNFLDIFEKYPLQKSISNKIKS